MIKNILFDFDSVILDSMQIRDYGFKEIFKEFDKEVVEKLIDYHNHNGGLSRYVKIRYFYKELLGQNISDKKVQELAQKFSGIMKKELLNKKYVIEEIVNFIEYNHKKYNLHIVSGFDGEELKYLCKEVGIKPFFLSIEGSPTSKNDLVTYVLQKNSYLRNETILIGDSINAYEATKINNIDFYGFNNVELRDVSKTYIDSFKDTLFLDYGVGENSTSKENKTFYKINNTKKIDYLLYLDSRGLTIDEDNFENTYMFQYIQKLKMNNKTFIAVSRPKNLVTFATLLNFLSLNTNFLFKRLITNVGFVDYTPKKEIFVQDMISQASHLYSENFDLEKLSVYKMSMNEDNLYSLNYSKSHIEFIRKYLMLYKFEKIYLINTPIINHNIDISRKRPSEFFDKIRETNILIDKITDNIDSFFKVDISEIFSYSPKSFSYDAVHYTLLGHNLIKEKLLIEDI